MMQKGWKIAIVVLLIAAAAVAISLKNRGSSEKTSSVKEPPAAVVTTTEETGAVDVKKTTPEDTSTVKETTAVKPIETTDANASTAAEQPKPSKPSEKSTVVNPKPVEPAKTEPEKPARLPKLLDLGSTMCIPCQKMIPILNELKKEYAGKLEVVVIDVQEDKETAETYNIQFIPTQIFFDSEGKEVYRHVGFFSKEDILKSFKDHGIDLGK